jgi:hypothetical protein
MMGLRRPLRFPGKIERQISRQNCGRRHEGIETQTLKDSEQVKFWVYWMLTKLSNSMQAISQPGSVEEPSFEAILQEDSPSRRCSKTNQNQLRKASYLEERQTDREPIVLVAVEFCIFEYSQDC